MRFSLSIVVFVAVGCVISPAQTKTTANAPSQAEAQESNYIPVHRFDPKRDAAADIQEAIREAQRTGKRIILDVGGDWCPWCHVLDGFFEKHPEIVELRDKNFITVNVFYGSENKNENTLSKYPNLEGVPHFFVLEKDGTCLYSQSMAKLGHSGEPNREKWKDFLTKWSSPTTGNAAKTEPTATDGKAPKNE
jgi:thiol:disulfide interchange protein